MSGQGEEGVPETHPQEPAGQESTGADGEQGEQNDRTNKSKGAGRNRGKGGNHGGGHGGSGKGGHSGGRSQSNSSIKPLILGEAPQVRLKEASHLKGAAEHCILCWEEQPSYVSIGRCRHAEVCWVCTLRLRFLNQDTRCPLCNEELGEVLLTNDKTASVEPMDLLGLNHEHPWIYFADDIIRRAVLALLGYRCQIERCAQQKDSAFRTLRQLEDHLWYSHWRQLCSVCLHDRPAFVCEQRVYASADIDRHNREGDPAYLMEQRAMPTVPPHPRCQFCKQRFFNDESLLAHMYRRHVVCQLCDSLGQKNEFYLNLKCLSRHYQERHFVCAHKDCEQSGYRQTAFAEERALIEHYEKVHKQSFKDEKGRTKLSVGAAGYVEEDASNRRRKGSGRGGSADDVDHVQFRWPSNVEPEDYSEAAGSEDQGAYYNRYPTRDIVPLRSDKGGNWRVANKTEGDEPEAAEDGDTGETPVEEGGGKPQRDVVAEDIELLPELEKLCIDCAFGAEGRSGAPSCLSALHAALQALVTENEAEAEGWDIKLLPAIRRLNRTEVETLETMRIYLHDNDSKEEDGENGENGENGDSIDWEPLERILGLRPALRRLLHVDKVKPPTNARSRQAIGPRQGQTQVEEQEDEKGWREWKQLAQVRIQALAPKAQQRLLRYVELCVQRRSALEQIGEGVPDWEDENIEQVFPSLSQSTFGQAVPSTQPAEMNSMARHARGWADMAAGHTREAVTDVEQFPALGGGTATAARPSWGPQRNAPSAPKEPADRGGQPGPVATTEAPKNDLLQKEAFPSLGGKTTVAPENIRWGAPNGTSPGDPAQGAVAAAASSSKREMTLEEWAKPKAKQEKKDLNFSNAEAFPSLGPGGSSGSRAVPTWGTGARNIALPAPKANSAKEAKEAKVAAAAKEAAEAIAEAKASRATTAKKVEEQVANDVNNFPELPSTKSSAPKEVQPKKASKAAAKPTPKAVAASSKVPKEEVPQAAQADTRPLHLDQDLVLIKKSEDEEPQAKEGSQKKKKGQQNKKNVIPASEWFQG